jgi:hypothetical protein
MATQTQGIPGYYVWEVEGKPVAVHLNLDVVDRILGEVMRGFAAVPKRGAEVGGVLLGTIEHGDVAIVHVEDFEAVQSPYKHGPSYSLDPEDRARFKETCRRWQPDESRPVYAVGYYRSHTRDGMSLAPSDVELMEDLFPSPAHVALLIKPYGTKVSLGGFFFRVDGVFPASTGREFPFRRRELSGGEEQPPRPPMERKPREIVVENPRSDPIRQAAPEFVTASGSRLRSAVWIPLSFVFLLFGVALGLMIALARGPMTRDAQDFSLGLSISRADDNLSVKWDREAVAIRGAQRGALEIEDGTYTKSVDLDAAQLKNGSIIYRNTTNTVRFRLVVFPKARVSIAETMEWKQ